MLFRRHKKYRLALDNATFSLWKPDTNPNGLPLLAAAKCGTTNTRAMTVDSPQPGKPRTSDRATDDVANKSSLERFPLVLIQSVGKCIYHLRRKTKSGGVGEPNHQVRQSVIARTAEWGVVQCKGVLLLSCRDRSLYCVLTLCVPPWNAP